MAFIFHKIAMIRAEHGIEFQTSLIESIKWELLGYKNNDVVLGVKIITAGKDQACSECLKQEGKEFTIEEALKIMPLPCKSCTNDLLENHPGWCRCCYNTIIKED